ncbi:hypothetical protein P389DRAFT_191299 [Cystobasidium minutum MCA 4210]|uniref:uncharacterized protein n=1 Tax=Cystobasidium minutum MCA 4210 TaxID=1397322 RepID=UPI0034CD5585|eukprot:jgi/Rhomi1/191299/estExt_fgenesh1_pg.C_80051
MTSQAAGSGEPGNPAGTPTSKRHTTSLSSGFSASVSSLRDATSSSAQNFISDLIATSLPTTSVDGAKASLSLRTTTLQFTRFVHKAGPVFAVQDAIESVFRWQDPTLTLLVGCAWAIICLYPQLLLLVPSASLATVLLYNHSRRFPPEPISLDNPYQESSTVKPPPSGQPPTEGSVDYFQNLQNIQELMGRVADMTDAGRQLVPYFNWSNRRFSLVMLQLASATFILTATLLFFFHSQIDMRYVFLSCGEMALLASHPLSQSALADLSSAPSTKLRLIKLKALGAQVLQDDALPDSIVMPNEKGENQIIKEIVVYENERRSLDGSWSTDVLKLEDWKPWEVLLDNQEYVSKSNASGNNTRTLNTSTSSTRSDDSSASPSREAVKLETITPPRGYIWIPEEDWKIDLLGIWTADAYPEAGKSGYVDSDGWASVDADGNLLTPPAVPGTSNSTAAIRKRRWFRRIVTTSVYL